MKENSGKLYNSHPSRTLPDGAGPIAAPATGPARRGGLRAGSFDFDPAMPSHVLYRGDCEAAIELLARAHPQALALLPCDHLARLLVHGRDCGAISDETVTACLQAARDRLHAIAAGEIDGGGA